MRILSDNIQMVYYIFCFVGYLLAGSIFWRARENSKRLLIRKKPLELVKDFMVKDIDQSEVNQLIKKAGIKTNLLQFQLLRFIFCWGSIILTFASSIYKGVSVSYTTPLILLIVFFVSAPSETIFKFKSPFWRLANVLIRRKQKQYNNEITRAVSQLKSLAITKSERPPGSTFILEYLAKFTDKTRPMMERMQSLWAMGQKDQACEYFAAAIDTPEAETFTSIIRKIDSLNPIELKSQMELFQEDIRRKRETERIKENEVKSHLIYGVIIISLMAILINFLFVGIFIDMMGGLKSIN